MATSYNGYEVIPEYGDLRLAPIEANGRWVFLPYKGVLAGDVALILNTLVNWLDANVEKAVAGQCWSYTKKTVTGGSGWSCHASGTAIDYNTLIHPQGYKRIHGGTSSWSADQVKKIDAYLAGPLNGVVRWGEHYSAPTKDDGQHFEIMGTPFAVAALADAIRNPPVIGKKDPTPTPSTGDLDMDAAELRQIIVEEVTKVIRTEGVKGAGDLGRLWGDNTDGGIGAKVDASLHRIVREELDK